MASLSGVVMGKEDSGNPESGYGWLLEDEEKIFSTKGSRKEGFIP